FVMGMEIKRELVHGELSSLRKAALPAVAALGGMAVPAAMFIAFNATGEGAKGWGIPKATDIAFALGVLALLGRSLPSGLRIFLLGVAVVDDIGSILVIAVFYTEELNVTGLVWAFALLVIIVIASRVVGIRSIPVYVVLGTLFWVAVLNSGIHATVAGVILGLLTPAGALLTHQAFRPSVEELVGQYERAVEADDEESADVVLGEISRLSRETDSPLDRLELQLHPWTTYLILPIFALANAGVVLSADVIRDAISSAVTLGVLVALPVGKLLGITIFTWLAVRTGVASLPSGVTWRHIIGVALLGGIGFTVSIFIAGLAYDVDALTSQAKIGVLLASVLSAVAGYAFLRAAPVSSEQPNHDVQQVPVASPGAVDPSGPDSEN
ncbi:MAG: Na+/H+ antiporter NhaA, partial [Chloroflexi bacterium]|nr:Na+/H+ antiporter NhaA [Chloroflexota bacterium]